jgi:hypothetical protein
MREGIRLPSPALAIAALALFVALGGTVYAAKKAKIDGRAVKVKSLPGNRIKVGSLAANRLKPGALTTALAQSGPITGAEIDELSLGQVPDAAHAESADNAQNAVQAQTAVNAVNAINAQTVNGHNVGCLPGTQQFAGACWQNSPSETAISAPAAATSCAVQGGTLPDPLQLATFSQQPGITLDSGNEWSSDITNMTGPDAFAVVIVGPTGVIDFNGSTKAHKYRCVIPLIN